MGAHRTASTAFQQMLTRNGPTLAASGVRALVHTDLVPETGFAAIPRNTDWSTPLTWLQHHAAGASQLLISEENLIGDMETNLRQGRFYGTVRKRLMAYRQFFEKFPGQAPARIGLGIREYGDYWVSAHGVELLYRNVTAQGVARFADLRKRLVQADRGWLDVISDIRGVFPNSELIVWPVEARYDLCDLARRLVGQPGLDLADAPRGVNLAPDQGHFPALETWRAAHPAASRSRAEAWLATQPPEEFTAFRDKARARMMARYAEDLYILEQGFADTTLMAAPPSLG